MSQILDALKKLDRERSSRPNGAADIAVEILRPNLPRPAKRILRYIPAVSLRAVVRIFAWVDLIASIIGAIWIWNQFGKSDAAYSLGHFLTNPLGIAIGIAVLLQGVFSCAFFLLAASIGENLIFLREHLDKKGKSCPECAEAVKVEARVCRFCGHRFAPPRPRLVSIETLSPPGRGTHK